MSIIAPSPRVRPSPFYEATVAEGMTHCTVYNHMIMPTSYGDPDAEYDRLVNGVAMWDVAAERQVELLGPEAGRLAQRLCARDISEMPEGMGWYVAVCDRRGTILNDPILLKLADDRYWLSIADSDVLWWARAVAAEDDLEVEVFEPDVSPLAVQGPKSFDTVAAIFGDWVRDMKYFEVRPAEVDGIPVMVARSGWSKQGGFEIYLMNGARGGDLWTIVKNAGADYSIGPGAPNQSERVESGLLSWGTDTDDETNPFEVRMGRFVDLDAKFIGAAALRKIKREGVKRRQVGLVLSEPERMPTSMTWIDAYVRGERVGSMTTNAWSPRMGRNIGLGLISSSIEYGDTAEVVVDGARMTAEVRKLPFL